MSVRKSRVGDLSQISEVSASVKVTAEVDAAFRKLLQLKKGQLLNEEEVASLVRKVTIVLQREPPYFTVDPPVVVVGSLHGHFEDLLHILEVAGDPPLVSYIFLGNFVDKGTHSLPLVLYLFCLKVIYPKEVVLVRGAHESISMNKTFTFYDECLHLYNNAEVYRLIAEAYKHLPVAIRVSKAEVDL